MFAFFKPAMVCFIPRNIENSALKIGFFVKGHVCVFSLWVAGRPETEIIFTQNFVSSFKLSLKISTSLSIPGDA